ncbi:MAG: thioredoxin family protein [Planctomycetota bacterium]|jgi:thioredoxin-related protein
MRKLASVALIAFILAAPTAALADDGDGAKWYDDYDEAAAAAKEEGKDLLVDFTGSDWCGWCIRPHDEVFKHETFWKPATESFVLVALDFPRGKEAKAKVPNADRNAELQAKHGIRGFPTILLMTADGDVYGRTGYKAGGPEKYLEHVTELRTKGLAALKEIKAIEKSFTTAKPEEKPAVLETVVAKLEAMSPGDTGLGKVAEMARTSFTSDPENEQGLKQRVVEALVKAGQVDADVYAAAVSVDEKNEKGVRESALAGLAGTVSAKEHIPPVSEAILAFADLGKFQDKDRCVHMFANGAFWNHKFLEDPEAAKKLARKVKELQPEPNPRLKPIFYSCAEAD